MALLMPKFGFSHCTENLGTLSATTVGVNFTAGNTDVDGTAVSMLAALTHDVHYLVIGIGGINTAGADAQAALDVLVDPAGGTSWAALINDLACGFTPVPTATVGLTNYYYFPLWIKSGNSVGIRCKTAHTADVTTGQVAMWGFGEPLRPDSWWCGQGVETVGIADSRGTSVTPGGSGTFGSWTSVGSATSARFGAIQMGVNGTDSNALANGWKWQMGVGSQQIPGSPTIWKAVATSEQGALAGQMPVFCDIAAGTQLQARATVSSASTEAGFCSLYGVY